MVTSLPAVWNWDMSMRGDKGNGLSFLLVCTLIFIANPAQAFGNPLPNKASISLPRSATFQFHSRATTFPQDDFSRKTHKFPPRPFHPLDQLLPFDALGPSVAPGPPHALESFSAPSSSMPSSAILSQSFEALDDSNAVIPPDTHGAVGPNHLMVTLNSQVRIQDKTGIILDTMTLETFWNPLGVTDVFDPKIMFDPFGQRWVFTTVAERESTASSVLLGVSETEDPTGNWNIFQMDADSSDTTWADFPSIGFNANWIVVTVNMFDIGGSGSFQRSHIYACDKLQLYTNGTLSCSLFQQADGFAMAPAQTYDDAVTTMYLLEHWNGNMFSSGFLRLSTISGAIGSEVLTPGVAFPATSNPWASQPPNDFAPQLGSSRGIMTNDSRLANVVYRNGRLWTTQTVFLPANGPLTRSPVQWWRISLSGSTQQVGRIDDPSGVLFYAFPSIAVNRSDDAVLGFSRFSANQYASGNFAFRDGSLSTNVFGPDEVLKAGEAFYVKTFSGTRNRWGDYSNTVVDPVNDTTFWTIQEYAATPGGGSDRWGTWWGHFEPPEGNDQFASAYLMENVNGVTVGTNLNATKEVGEPDHAGKIGGTSVWWTLEAPITGTVGFSTEGSSFNTLLAVYTGGSVDALTLIASDDNSGTNGTSQLAFVAIAGTSYHIVVDGFQGATGDVTLTSSVNNLFPLSVTVVGTGLGSVTSNPFGIQCPVDCLELYPDGTSVTLTALAEIDSQFSGWSGEGCTGMGTCLVTMTQSRNVTASFEAVIPSYSLDLTVTGQGSVISSPTGISCPGLCQADFPAQTTITLTPTPDPGWTFMGWSGSMDCLDGVVMLTQAESCTAHFGTLLMNMGGEETLVQLASSVSLDFCDNLPIPQHFVSAAFGGFGEGALEVWACLRNGEPDLFRLAKGSTVDGIEKLLVPESESSSHMFFLPAPEHITGCDEPILLTRPFDNKSYYEWEHCSGGAISVPLHVGLAGVRGPSLGQVGPGPSFSPPDPGFSVNPLDDSELNLTEIGIVPFSIFLGRDVGVLDAAGNLTRATSISSTTLESILNGVGAIHWQQFGFDTGVVGGSPDAGMTNIDICHHRAGSGAKAVLDVTIMKNSSENTVGVNVLDVATDLTSASAEFFLPSTEGVRKCLDSDTQGHSHGIGYMNADQVTKLAGADAYVVAIDGVFVRDEAAAARFPFLNPRDADYEAAAKQGLRCGHYRYWSEARMNTRTTSTGNATLDALIATFVTMASTPAAIKNSTAGLYWETPHAMAVFKNNDTGPHIFKSGVHTECRLIANPNFPN